MVAINFMTGNKYDCNRSNDWDLICLQSGSKKALYACIVDEKGDLIWMQSQFQRRLNVRAISNPKRTIYAFDGPNKLGIIDEIVDGVFDQKKTQR